MRSESVSHVALLNELAVESIQAIQRDMIGAMQKLVEQVEKLEVVAKQQCPICRDRVWTCHPGKVEADNGIQEHRSFAEDATSQGTMLKGVLPSWTNRG